MDHCPERGDETGSMLQQLLKSVQLPELRRIRHEVLCLTLSYFRHNWCQMSQCQVIGRFLVMVHLLCLMIE